MAAEKEKLIIDINVAPPSVNASPSVEQVKMVPQGKDVASLPPMRAVASMQVAQVVSETLPAFTLSPSAQNSIQGPGRGHPCGSENLQPLASIGEFLANSATRDFRAHVIHIDVGEDVIGKVISLVQNGPRGICIISANGAVSGASIGSSDGVSSFYEEQCQIISLTGSFTVAETEGGRCRTGGFNVLLASQDGRVIGGAVAGPLFAASLIQAVVGSFIPNAHIGKQQAPRPKHGGGREGTGQESNPRYQQGLI